jgi:hypothetical protein
MTTKSQATHLCPEPTGFLLRGWERAIRAIRVLHSLAPDWDGAGGRPVPADKIASAVRFCQLMRDAKQPPPSAVYPLVEGNIMIDWRSAEGVVVRFEVESPGRGEFMTTFPDGRKTQFQDYHWEADPAFQYLPRDEPERTAEDYCREAEASAPRLFGVTYVSRPRPRRRDKRYSTKQKSFSLAA